jgi:hypothetical protein
MKSDPPEYSLAALIRQYVRAASADDKVAANQMFGLLARDLESLFVSLLGPALKEHRVELWFDGIGGQQVNVRQPFGLQILGSIWCCGGPQDCYLEQPLAAAMRAAANHSSLEAFVARFGDRENLVAKGIIQCEACDYEMERYQVRIGESVPLVDGLPFHWAFEFTKLALDYSFIQQRP